MAIWLVCVSCLCSDPSFSESLATIRAVGPNGERAASASKAWPIVAAADVGQIPAVLAAMDDANPVARNWLRSAIDQICEAARQNEKPLPAKELEAFLRDTKHNSQARRLAYDLVVEADAKAAERLLPTFLDDPSPELRRDAVALVLNEAEKTAEKDKTEAIVPFKKALTAARDVDQINKAAKRLRDLGEPPDLPVHLGLILDWKLIGPFPNADSKGVKHAYPPEKGLDFAAEYDGKEGKVKWSEYVSKDPMGTIDLNIGIGKHIDSVAYAATEFTCKDAQDAEIRLGCFTAFTLWVNGELVLERGDAYTGMRLDHYVAQAKLRAGKNVILLKSCQADPPAPLPKHWRFMLRVCDKGGNAILSTTRHNPDPAARASSAACGLATAAILLTPAADWRQFRGTDLTGIANDGGVPVQFSGTENVAWKAPLAGRGPASPIVVGDRVFVTAAGGPRNDHLYVFAFDTRTGEKLWRRTFWGTGPTAAHPKSNMAAPTPASDGKCVVALFGTNDLACLGLDGRVLWLRALHEEYPGATDGRGLASSPIIVGDVVIVHVENQNVSFAAGIDIKTGANRWRIDRPREICWTTPIRLPGKTEHDALVLLQGMTHLTAVAANDGREVWNLDRASDPIASSVLAGNVLLVPGEKGLAAYELQPDGKAPKLLWESNKLNPVTASPVVIGDRVYSLRNEILVNGDMKTGEVRGQLRLKGPFSASVVAAGGLLYCANEAGIVHVVKPDDKDGEILARNEMKETLLATPAITNGALYLRDDHYLWKIATAQE